MTTAARQVLLLCNDPAWMMAAEHEFGGTGSTVDRATSALDALYRLVEPSHRIGQLLLEPRAAGPLVRDLVGVTAGETGSQVELVLLGDDSGVSGSKTVRHARTPAELGRHSEHRCPRVAPAPRR